MAKIWMKYTWSKEKSIASFPENRDKISVFIFIMEGRGLSEYGEETDLMSNEGQAAKSIIVFGHIQAGVVKGTGQG